MNNKKQDLILYVYTGAIHKENIQAIRSYNKKNKTSYKIGVLRHSKIALSQKTLNNDYPGVDEVVVADLDKHAQVLKAIHEIQGRVNSISARGEKNVNMLAKVIPQFPYILTPTQESINWARNKIDMRRRFKAYDPDITPKYMVIDTFNEEKIQKILTKVGLPVVVKPADLSSSKYVTVCFHEDELRKAIKKVLKGMKAAHKELKDTKPKILVEHFMEGNIYSIDGYVDSVGNIVYCPIVKVTTGWSKGYNDFFGYIQMTPSTLKPEKIEMAEKVATKGVYALGLRSTTVHVELIKTDQGWKILEIGARMGGFRHSIYELSQGINHVMNDALNRMGKKVVIPKRGKGYAVAMKFFAKKEGKITKILGLKKIKKLESFYRLDQNKKNGDIAKYANKGGESVFNLIMFNKTRAGLLADIRRCEESINIVVEA